MHLTRDGVQCQIAEAERGGIGRFVDRGAAQQRAHPGQQLLQRKGLGQVVVGARIQPGHSLRDRIASGKDQDRQIIPVLRRRRHTSRPSSLGIITSSTNASGRSLAITFSASTPSSARSTEYPLKDKERRNDSRTARSSSTTRIRTGTSVNRAAEILLRKPENRLDQRSATVEVDEPEAGSLQQATRNLVVLSADSDVDQLGGGGLPLRAPATGVRATFSAWGRPWSRPLLISQVSGLFARAAPACWAQRATISTR